MIIRRLGEVPSVDWGNGHSRRFLLAADGMGFTLTDTLVHRGSTTRIEYPHHLEAVYCIAGSGRLIELGGAEHTITPGTMYALDQHEPHLLAAGPDQDLQVVCVFVPPLHGSEVAGPLVLQPPESHQPRGGPP